jgi:hypothetical protein
MSIAHGEIRFSAQHNKLTRKHHIPISAHNATRRTTRLYLNQGHLRDNQIDGVIQTISKVHLSPTHAQIARTCLPNLQFPPF